MAPPRPAGTVPWPESLFPHAATVPPVYAWAAAGGAPTANTATLNTAVTNAVLSGRAARRTRALPGYFPAAMQVLLVFDGQTAHAGGSWLRAPTSRRIRFRPLATSMLGAGDVSVCRAAIVPAYSRECKPGETFIRPSAPRAFSEEGSTPVLCGAALSCIGHETARSRARKTNNNPRLRNMTSWCLPAWTGTEP